MYPERCAIAVAQHLAHQEPNGAIRPEVLISARLLALPILGTGVVPLFQWTVVPTGALLRVRGNRT